MKGKRRRHDPEFKARVALEALKGIKTIQQIAKEFDIHPVQVSDWKKTMAQGAASVFGSGAGGTEAESFERERAQLHAKIGQQAVELDWLTNNPLFPALRSGPTAVSGASRQKQIPSSKKDGFRVDGVGNQAHVDESFLPTPEHVLAVTDHFATLVTRQVITDFDITTLQDEELAADYTRDLLIACFSHPACTGFLLWGFWEGRHWKPEAASWNLDWTIRKRGEVLEEWIGRRRSTTVTLTTGKEGEVCWRGFPGWYDISNKAGDKMAAVKVTKQPVTGK